MSRGSAFGKVAAGALCCVVLLFAACVANTGHSASVSIASVDHNNEDFQLLLAVDLFSAGPVSPPYPGETVWDYQPHAAYMNLY